jgi:hypothetical protein
MKGDHESKGQSAMTQDEGIQRLKTICNDAVRLLDHLEKRPSTAAQEAELRQLAGALKSSLEEEYQKIIPERTQKKMSLFELTVFSPTIEEAWKGTGINRLKIEGTISKRWQNVFEAVAYKTSKYTS